MHLAYIAMSLLKNDLTKKKSSIENNQKLRCIFFVKHTFMFNLKGDCYVLFFCMRVDEVEVRTEMATQTRCIDGVNTKTLLRRSASIAGRGTLCVSTTPLAASMTESYQ